MQSRSGTWIGVAAGLTGTQVAARLVLRPGLALTAVSDVATVLLILVLLLAFAAAAVSTRGRLRSVWMLMAVSWGFWLADECSWTFYDLALRRPLPAMFPGDALLFLAGVPVLGALLLHPHIESPGRGIRLGTLDFLQLMLWWVYFYIYLVTCWQYVHKDTFLYNRNFDRLYFLQFLIIVACSAHLLRQTRSAWSHFYSIFLAVITLTYLSVIAQNHAIETGVYFEGSWYDVLFAVALLFFTYVAVRGRDMVPLPAASADRRYATWLTGLATTAVLSLPMMAAYAVFDRSVPADIARFRVLATLATILLMSTLVFAKLRRLHLDLTETNAVLQHASITDPLTGVRNRRFFSETIEADAARALRAFVERRSPGGDLIFYLIDLDNFKEVNDRFGHHAGDRVLVEVANRIGSVMRASDVLVRWGGEEFLIVSHLADRNHADVLALRVMQVVRQQPYAIDEATSLRRTCSVGWAAFPWQEEEPAAVGYEAVLNQADQALNQAKMAGKNRAVGMVPFHGGTLPTVKICGEPPGSGPLTQAFDVPG